MHTPVLSKSYAFLTIGWLLLLPSCKSVQPALAPSDAEQIVHVVTAVEAEPETKKAKITFDSTSYHLGSIKKGDLISRELHFRNTGEQDLIIELMSACECTTLDWPRLPIKPGKKGIIKLRYDSKDKEGPQIVDIEIMANTDPETSYTKFYIFVQP